MATDRTLLGLGESFDETKKSRFWGRALPLADADEAAAALAAMRADNPQATAIAYAWRVGGAERISDGGEPTGTAGQPLMSLLRGRGVIDVGVFVARIYGGTPLGTGGLVRAFSTTGQAAITAAGLAQLVPCKRLQLRAPYALWDRVEHYAKTNAVALVDAVFAADITVVAQLLPGQEEGLLAFVAGVGQGNIIVEELETTLIRQPVEETI